MPRELRAPHLLGLQTPEGVEAATLVARLASHGVYVAERGGMLRVGAHIFNDEQDVDRFGSALCHCLA